MYARIVPFCIYMAFIALEEALRYLGSSGVCTLGSDSFLLLYPLKIAAVVIALWHYRTRYPELRWNDLSRPGPLLFSIGTGIAVFALWIQMTWPFAVFGTLHGYDPGSIQESTTRTMMIVSRLFGASLVVPVMEELFWRSFVVRYIIKPEFEQVPVGTFTFASFLISSVLFGLEHNLWLAGIMAGAAYNLVLFRTGSIAHCIVAHAVTNALLGCYVLMTQSWHFW